MIRIKAFEDTYSTFEEIYPYENTPEVFLGSFEMNIPLFGRSANINISMHDCLDDSYFLAMTEKTLIVNSANSICMGGDVKYGIDGIEENICLRTNLYDAFEQASEMSELTEWPLSDRVKGIYTHDITVFKGSEFNYTEPFNIDVLSLFPKHMNDETKHHMLSTLFYVCNKYTCIKNLVFVPIGCDEKYSYDPYDIALSFKHYLCTYSIGKIENIIISCSGDMENYEAFKSVFSKTF